MVLQILFSALTVAAYSFGSCPTLEKARDPVAQNMTALGGLWYEYVSSDGYRANTDYSCATWNLLKHGDVEGNHMYDMIHHGQNLTTNQTFFNMNTFQCGLGEKAYSCQLNFLNPENIVQKAVAAV